MHYVFFVLIHLDMFAFYALGFGLLLCLTSWKYLGRRVILVSSLFLLIIAITPLTRYSMQCLEERFPIPTLPEKVDGLILLGGNFSLHESTERGFAVHNLAGSRLYEFMLLMRRFPAAKVAFTGTPLEAKLTREILTQHGLDAGRIIFENQSKNTRDNVKNLMKYIQPKPNEKWVLVTSAFHIPRSVGLMRGEKWDVIPYPVDYHTSGKTKLSLCYDRYAFLTWSVVMKEVAGLINNWREGLSSELFPKPAA